VLADSLVELANIHYSNVTQSIGVGHKFFRLFGSRSQSLGTNFEFAAVRLQHGDNSFYYRAKAGDLLPKALAEDMASFGPVANWPREGTDKQVVGPRNEVASIFTEGCHVFFPATRYELPYWVNVGHLERDPTVDFSLGFINELAKPIVIESTSQAIKPWIIEALVDSNVNASEKYLVCSL
jgi:hypothetical protein